MVGTEQIEDWIGGKFTVGTEQTRELGQNKLEIRLEASLQLRYNRLHAIKVRQRQWQRATGSGNGDGNKLGSSNCNKTDQSLVGAGQIEDWIGGRFAVRV